MNYLIVFLGAGVGGAGRHGVNLLAARFFGAGFPMGTLAVNVIGCFVMGAIAGVFAFRGHLPQEMRLFLTTGILGGFTTFSAFSLDAALLWERGEAGLAATYVGISVLLSLAGVAAGLALTRVAFAGGGM
ncbi:fluoride efflux transporter CrcB [Rhizobium sp. TRM95111]|uniref:fluoride efflux transporter CrcB n=1 Tax=Rhizobium alarense TaxID=2846851 RepID=UPI001F2DAFF4|nr:fluoride efflux transporter CrcB [Rhizobium alarense]MCF3638511.1 fluoride efflux transporter CrcB [Rhizobium alarense]